MVAFESSEKNNKMNLIAPRPGFEPGSKAPQASRMSTTLPGQRLIRLGSDLTTSFSWLKNMCIKGNSEINVMRTLLFNNIIHANG